MKINIIFLLFISLFNSNLFAINKAIIILGQPGAGKGTQAQLLSEKLIWPTLAVSNLKRELAPLPVDKIYSQYIKPDPLARDIFKIGIMMGALPKRSEGYVILENWPKTQSSLDALLMMINKQDLFVVELLIPENRSIERVAMRKQCEGCGMTYGLARKELTANTCDSCKRPIVIRAHDNEEDYLKRLPRFYARQRLYHEVYKQHGINIYTLNTDSDPQSINSKILEQITQREFLRQ